MGGAKWIRHMWLCSGAPPHDAPARNPTPSTLLRVWFHLQQRQHRTSSLTIPVEILCSRICKLPKSSKKREWGVAPLRRVGACAAPPKLREAGAMFELQRTPLTATRAERRYNFHDTTHARDYRKHGLNRAHRRRHGAHAPVHPRPEDAQVDIRRRKGWCGKDDDIVLPRHSARKAPQICPPHLDRPRAQPLRCLQPEVRQGCAPRQRLRQPQCHGDRPQWQYTGSAS